MPNRVLRSGLVVAGLIFVSVFASWLAMRDFRAGGARPYFYQSNFEPAVMMACGRGFGVAQPPPVALVEFLHEQRDRFDCAEVASSAVVPLTAAAHASWYYLYGATAAVWKVTGVSWLAVDYLDAMLAGAATAMLFGLFRLVCGTGVSALLALILTLSPANLNQLLSLRDYSKAPFVLASVLILASLVLKPMSRNAIWSLAIAYGAVVGIGYGFRGDLVIMVPFGAFVVATLLPGQWRANLVRNTTAVAALIATFLAVASPILRGLDKGGCQFHVALLGLTTPLTEELALSPPLYRFGDSLTDTFAILKVGDYAARVRHEPVSNYCDAAYDSASGELYLGLARRFPADMVIRAYRSVWTVLRQGLAIPDAGDPAPFTSTAINSGYRLLNGVTIVIAPAGPVLMLAALVMAFAASARLGIALTVSVLFLAGYPAIQFEGRHWFHLRFIPWWAGALVVTQVLRRRADGWNWADVRPGVAATAALVFALAAALMSIRAVQGRSVERLLASYEQAISEPLAVMARSGGAVDVAWTPVAYGHPFDQRGSDLVMATLSSSACQGDGPLSIKVRYSAVSRAVDLSTEVAVPRPAAGAAPTRLFLPVFWSATAAETSQKFTGLDTVGAPANCIESVARVTNASDWPLWLQVVLPPDWRSYPLYQSLRLSRRLAAAVAAQDR